MLQRFLRRVVAQELNKLPATKKTRLNRRMVFMYLILFGKFKHFVEENAALHIFVLLIAIAGWVYSSFPLLKHMIYALERKWSYKLFIWFFVLYICVFFIVTSLDHLFGWPAEGSIARSIMKIVLLVSTYLIPFIVEGIRSLLRKRN